MPETVTLKETEQNLVDRLVRERRYAGPDEVVRAAFALLERHERERQAALSEIEDLVDEGLASGPAEPLEIDAIIRRARSERLQE